MGLSSMGCPFSKARIITEIGIVIIKYTAATVNHISNVRNVLDTAACPAIVKSNIAIVLTRAESLISETD